MIVREQGGICREKRSPRSGVLPGDVYDGNGSHFHGRGIENDRHVDIRCDLLETRIRRTVALHGDVNKVLVVLLVQSNLVKQEEGQTNSSSDGASRQGQWKRTGKQTILVGRTEDTAPLVVVDIA